MSNKNNLNRFLNSLVANGNANWLNNFQLNNNNINRLIRNVNNRRRPMGSLEPNFTPSNSNYRVVKNSRRVARKNFAKPAARARYQTTTKCTHLPRRAIQQIAKNRGINVPNNSSYYNSKKGRTVKKRGIAGAQLCRIIYGNDALGEVARRLKIRKTVPRSTSSGRKYKSVEQLEKEVRAELNSRNISTKSYRNILNRNLV